MLSSTYKLNAATYAFCQHATSCDAVANALMVSRYTSATPRRARLTCLGDVQDLIAGWTDVSSRSLLSSLRSHAVFCGFSQTHTKPLMDLSLSLFETHRTVIAIARYGTVGQSDAMSFRRNSHRWRGHCLTSGG